MNDKVKSNRTGAILLTAIIAWIVGLFSMAFVFKMVDIGKPKHESILQIRGSKHHWQQWAIVDKNFTTITPLGDTIHIRIDYPKLQSNEQ